MISAQVIKDSTNEGGNRLITLVLTYPRFIHPQIMTHRTYSRNVSSSRAVPASKMIEEARNNPVFPINWGENKRGMQAGDPLEVEKIELARKEWASAASSAADHAERLAALGLHKQHVNRVLEPFVRVSVILSGTEFSNFFDLRLSHNAQPEMQELALQMRNAIEVSNSQMVRTGNWHIPFVTDEEVSTLKLEDTLLISATRCARVSYVTHGNIEPNREKDLTLGRRLARDRHLSPFEHQAMALNESIRTSNFVGWLQQRHMIKTGEEE